MTRKQFLAALFTAPLAALGVRKNLQRNELVPFPVVSGEMLRLLEHHLAIAHQCEIDFHAPLCRPVRYSAFISS